MFWFKDIEDNKEICVIGFVIFLVMLVRAISSLKSHSIKELQSIFNTKFYFNTKLKKQTNGCLKIIIIGTKYFLIDI